MIFCPQFANSPRNFCHLRQLTECNIHPTPYTTFNTLFTFSCSAMLRHSRWAGHRAGDFHAKISGQDMPVKTQGAGFYESAQDFSLFYFFLFLRCLSGYLFFAENHIKFWIIIRNLKLEIQKNLHFQKSNVSLQSDSKRIINIRGVAQLASASGLGPEGPVFESQYPDIETETDFESQYPDIETETDLPASVSCLYLTTDIKKVGRPDGRPTLFKD